jgi:hypothetical protein
MELGSEVHLLHNTLIAVPSPTAAVFLASGQPLGAHPSAIISRLALETLTRLFGRPLLLMNARSMSALGHLEPPAMSAIVSLGSRASACSTTDLVSCTGSKSHLRPPVHRAGYLIEQRADSLRRKRR